jgi:hypothetical protein
MSEKLTHRRAAPRRPRFPGGFLVRSQTVTSGSARWARATPHRCVEQPSGRLEEEANPLSDPAGLRVLTEDEKARLFAAYAGLRPVPAAGCTAGSPFSRVAVFDRTTSRFRSFPASENGCGLAPDAPLLSGVGALRAVLEEILPSTPAP